MIKLFAKHHNKIQFFGYEVANVVLILQQMFLNDTNRFALNSETYTAIFFLIGSALIWQFDSQKRPSMLFWGGIALAIGGIFLTLAGYWLTGMAVVVASLETARGGLLTLHSHIDAEAKGGRPARGSLQTQLSAAHYLLGWYARPVARLTTHFHGLGRFINDRPFVTGALIKAPLRLEFIGKKLLMGDWIGVTVGISWMLLGDVALAFNDEQLQALAEDKMMTISISA